MKILTEDCLRSACLQEETREYVVEAGTFVTPLAREFLRDRNITLLELEPGMPRQPVENRGAATYQDAGTGAQYAHKPEHMTHLRGSLLVEKTHPRIALRGALDSFQAQLLLVQADTADPVLFGQLGELLALARSVLSAEVREVPLSACRLLDMDEAELRDYSHHIPERLHIPHPIPEAGMGRTVLQLNLLRTQIRACELAAAEAFGAERQDLIQALNRMSSAIYILMCRECARQKGGLT